MELLSTKARSRRSGVLPPGPEFWTCRWRTPAAPGEANDRSARRCPFGLGSRPGYLADDIPVFWLGEGAAPGARIEEA